MSEDIVVVFLMVKLEKCFWIRLAKLTGLTFYSSVGSIWNNTVFNLFNCPLRILDMIYRKLQQNVS